MDLRDYAHINISKYTASKSERSIVLEIDDEQMEFAMNYDVCPTCEGRGRHVDPNIDRNGINPSEESWDFMEDYMNGAYDVKCYECGGLRVVPVINTENLTEKQKEFLTSVYEAIEADMEFEHISQMERRMGY